MEGVGVRPGVPECDDKPAPNTYRTSGRGLPSLRTELAENTSVVSPNQLFHESALTVKSEDVRQDPCHMLAVVMAMRGQLVGNTHLTIR